MRSKHLPFGLIAAVVTVIAVIGIVSMALNSNIDAASEEEQVPGALIIAAPKPDEQNDSQAAAGNLSVMEEGGQASSGLSGATDAVSETAPEEAPPPANDAGKPIREKAILTNDDRPDGLRALTSSWNTNWSLHTIDYGDILSGGPPRDGIPSIDDPQFVTAAEAADWLAPNEPVIALEINGDARAYPLQVLTWHEIANDVVGDIPVVVTFCPLCNSALVFERIIDGQTVEFGVSGLLRNSDLIMYDRSSETLWQQFTGEAIVGDYTGSQLAFVPSSLVSFADFAQAFPQGVVLSRETGFSRNYGQNPYVGYDQFGGDPFLFRGELDGRLPATERVVTVHFAGGDVDVAYPLTSLSEAGVINDRQGDQDLVVFYSGGTSSALGAQIIAQAEDVGATGVFDPYLDGQRLTFHLDGEAIIDLESGSTWNVLGQATDGPLVGKTLTPIVHGDHFWFSWAAFRPDTIIYSDS